MSRRRYKCLGVGSELEVRSQSSRADSGQKRMAAVVGARHLEQAGRACVRVEDKRERKPVEEQV